MQRRYSSINQALHWVTALCMFAILPLAWVMTNMPTDAPSRAALFAWHETLGLIVLLVTAGRIIWRRFDGAPPYPAAVARWERRLAHATSAVFFLALAWMPVTGFLTAAYGGHQVELFDLVPTPAILRANAARAELFTSLHLAGQWAIYSLIALHLGAVAFHLIWTKAGVLGRMLPADATEPGRGDERVRQLRLRRLESGAAAPQLDRTCAAGARKTIEVATCADD
jgi:cytochrome b561